MSISARVYIAASTKVKNILVILRRQEMDTKELFSAASNFGFPMVLSWYLLLRMEQRLDRLTHCLNELSRAIISKDK